MCRSIIQLPVSQPTPGCIRAEITFREREQRGKHTHLTRCRRIHRERRLSRLTQPTNCYSQGDHRSGPQSRLSRHAPSRCLCIVALAERRS
ncbi:hypothetical protein L596_002671 [Steinernema carpocapsae]|uniref:Uncharacterized protein n=1 Tax=Steinernema carpocapsae TaxID=34508 RepID=A0A4U8UQ73_STECR|nr:hypothetical protein L596_002671 [Steinernema carpocapsae]